ncbi:MAG: SurA N-terminal domain-containing protein [Patescibacteria group bacterium]
MKNKILIAILILFVAVVLWFIFTTNYPIALVNLQPISAIDFNKNYASSLVYYKNALETYNNKDAKALEADEIKKEIKRALLENMIENILIDRQLKKEIKSSDLEKLIIKKIEEVINGQNIQEAVEKLYGFSFNDFKKRILIPQAKKEIFESRIFLSGENFEEKLKDIKSKAQIMIFLPGFEWGEKGVIIKE